MRIDKTCELERLLNGDYLYKNKVDVNENINIDLDDRIIFQERYKNYWLHYFKCNYYI